MLVYLYDGTMDGFWTALDRAIQSPRVPDQLIAKADWHPDMFSETHAITTDATTAKACLERFAGRIGERNLRSMMYAWMTGDPAMPSHVLRYALLGRRHGPRVHEFHADPAVRAVNEAARRVGAEIHRFKGILRFRQVRENGLLWGPMEPDFDIALPLSFHFRVRLRAERWIIHDVRRGAGAAWDGKTVTMVDEPEILSICGGLERPAETGEEKEIQKLWRSYFSSAAIASRRNLRLQRSHMPHRYWRYLTEMNAPTG